MKSYLLLILILLINMSCQTTEPTDNKMENQLKLKLKITEYGAVSYADIYACEIIAVAEGDFKQENISMTVIDRSELDNVSIDELPVTVNITFKKGNENEPYQTMPINGFVDENKTSWLLHEISKASDE